VAQTRALLARRTCADAETGPRGGRQGRRQRRDP
jgi:hypothetical protein